MTIPNSRVPAPRHPSARVRAAIGLASLAAVASIVGAAGSCGTATLTEPASPDSVHLAYGVRTPVQGTPLAFTFEKVVGDSRCSEDVVCVWAGDLRVQVRVENLVAAGPQPMTQLLEFSTANARVLEAFGQRIELINARRRGAGSPPPAESYWIAVRVAPIQTGEVTLTLDRASYAAGGRATMTIRSQSRDTLGYNTCANRTVQQLQGDDWSKVPEPGRVCTMELRLLLPGEAHTAIMELPRDLPSGTYRMVLTLGRQSASGGTVVSASPGFRVE